MSSARDIAVVALGAVVAVVLQVVLAPNIVLFDVQPNIMLAYVLALCIARPGLAGAGLPFVLGLLLDLLGTGPVGGMALLFVLVGFLASRTFMVLDNDSLYMPLVVFAAATFLVEMLYGIMLMAFGLSAGLADVFLYRALPCALYDCVAGLVLYPLVSRLLSPTASTGEPVITQTR